MRQEVYRVAFDEASAELSEIQVKFELLRVRKDRIEKVVEALKPLVASSETTASVLERASGSLDRPAPEAPSSQTQHAAAEAAPPAPGPIPYPVQPASPAGDPFARRLESAVGQSSSTAKDVSEYIRLFNTGVSRGN